MIYATEKVAWIEKIKPALRPGGLFVVEYFAQDPDDAGDGGFAPGQLAKLFASGFDILRDEVVEDAFDWALDRARLVRFVAKKRWSYPRRGAIGRSLRRSQLAGPLAGRAMTRPVAAGAEARPAG